LVACLWLLDTICTMLAMHVCYNYTVSHHARPLALLEIVWSLRVVVFLSGLLAFITHLFFAYRVHKLSGHNALVSATIGVTAMIRIGFSTAAMVLTWVMPNFARFLSLYSAIVSCTFGAAALSDIAVTACLFYFLCASEKPFSSSDSLFDKFLVYVINTGLLRSLVAVTALICIVTMKSNLVFIGVFFILSKMYTNSFMAVLNARRHTYVPSQIGSFDLGRDLDLEANNKIRCQGNLAVHITQEYHTTVDNGIASLDSESMPAALAGQTSTFKTDSIGYTDSDR